ncbi:F-box protein At2g35280-like [Raphanus sativus]|uniref:F-box protein At2g35280-like n=1 Tax=Raphanus sativus TaxID=3726 RepID=A0A9W3CM28_RAPSA|nr:F-box protein At2g35280-like [Raphanus sativus]
MGEDASVNNYDIISIGDSASSNDDHSNSDRTNYFRNISLSYFAAQPTEMLSKHLEFKELCFESGNPEAHYIEGILQLFVKEDEQAGLYHLRQSSDGGYIDGSYLYGLSLLAVERFHKGQKYLDKLGWKESRSTSDQCWERVKKSLTDIPYFMNQGYYIARANLETLCGCRSRKRRGRVCNHGYYYERLNQFVEFAMSKNN